MVDDTVERIAKAWQLPLSWPRPSVRSATDSSPVSSLPRAKWSCEPAKPELALKSFDSLVHERRKLRRAGQRKAAANGGQLCGWWIQRAAVARKDGLTFDDLRV